MGFTKVLLGSTWYWFRVAMDRFSREIVGWSLTRHGRAKELLAVLAVAAVDRSPNGVRRADLLPRPVNACHWHARRESAPQPSAP